MLLSLKPGNYSHHEGVADTLAAVMINERWHKTAFGKSIYSFIYVLMSNSIIM